MKLRGRVMKLEKVSGEAVRRASIHTDPVLWTRRFRSADPANEQIYQDICSHGDTHQTGFFFKGRPPDVLVLSCFKMIYFPITHAIHKDWEPTYGGFAQTPELLRRLVKCLWQCLRADRGPFPLYHHWMEAFAGADGADMRELCCLYADLADLWVADHRHPQILALRQYRAEAGWDQ